MVDARYPGGWRDIETAPIEAGKPGQPMLLFCPSVTSWNRYKDASPILVGAWSGTGWHSDVGDIDHGYESTGAYFEHEWLRPTHWMPLPAQPKEGGEHADQA